MRANRLMLSVAVGMIVLFAGCRSWRKGEPQQVELPVTEMPGRASNEDIVTHRPGGRGVSTVATTRPQGTPEPQPVFTNYAAEQYRLVNQSDEIVSVLKNGMVVIVKRMPSPVLAVRGYVKTGGVYEGKWLGGGLSHLLEHLVAGGSSQRRTEAENRDLLQKIGNNSNAYTTDDHTAYFINTTPDHLSEAVDLVSGWVLGALITPEEYRREYEVVQRELEKDKGEPDWVFYELGTSTRYLVSPMRVPTIGYQEVIQGLSRDDVFGYYKQTYQPNNMVFAVTGDVEPAKMLAAVQKYVGDAPPGRVPSHEIEGEPPVLSPRTSVATFPKLGQAKLQLAFPSVTIHDKDLYAMDLLATLLGGGESSVLVEELRDKKQLVSEVQAGDPTPAFVEGSFQINMELAPDKIGAATDETLALIDQVVKEGVSAERLSRAKAQMRANRVRGLQTSEDTAASLATDFMNCGDPHFTDHYIQRIEAVTNDQIKDVADRYFVRQRLLTTALVPAEYVGAGGLPKAEDVLRPASATTQESPAAAEAAKVTRAELPNGAILLHKRLATSPLVVVKVYSLGGVTAEDVKTNGLGNLAMEMLPRGTKTRSAQQIAEFFDSIGGQLETTCGNNTWSWSLTCLKGDVEKAMEVFGDVVNNPAFPEDQLGPMKKRVEAQIAMQDADWFQQAMRFFKREYFGPRNSPYQFLPTGKGESVESFTRDQLTQWYATRVMSGRRVVAVFGDIDLDKAQSLARQHLGAGEAIKESVAPSTQQVSVDMSSASPTPSIEVQDVKIQKTEQPVAGIVIGFNSNSIVGDPANFPIDVADTMCSGFGYPTGYLHEVLRGRGLVYMVHAQNWPGRSESLPGTFLVYAGCDPGKVNEVIDLILLNIARLQGTEADTQPGWFARSQQLIATADAMDNETPAEQAQTAGLDEINGLGYDYHDRFASRINAVKLDEVRKIAAAKLAKCVVTISTPAPDAVSVKPGRRTYDSFPSVDLTPRGVQHDSK